jgi:predicted RNase H-like HicB family nuclease
VPELPGVLAYGQTRQAAIDAVKALSFRVLADRLDNGEPVPQMATGFVQKRHDPVAVSKGKGGIGRP